jgi:anti-sigma regulatory factor (Ser/Thr protein kinase)
VSTSSRCHGSAPPPTEDAGEEPAGSGDRHLSWHLPATEQSVRTLRRGLRAFLDDTGLPPDALHDLLMATCEAAANAVEHPQEPSQPYFDVSFHVEDEQVTIVVRDHGRWRDGPSAAHRGRGLQMMTALAETRVEQQPDGTTVTMRPAATPPTAVQVGPEGTAT